MDENVKNQVAALDKAAEALKEVGGDYMIVYLKDITGLRFSPGMMPHTQLGLLAVAKIDVEMNVAKIIAYGKQEMAMMEAAEAAPQKVN